MLILLVVILLAALPPLAAAESTGYNLDRSRTLIAAGNALAEEAGAAVLEGILAGMPGDDDCSMLLAHLQDHGRRRALFAQAEALLKDGRYHDLNALLDNAEKEGAATYELLLLRGLPQALQALTLFCARAPYTRSEDLAQSLDFLQPYVAELSSRSSVFNLFYQRQQNLLAELRDTERNRLFAERLAALDWQLATDGGTPKQLLRAIARQFGDVDFFLYVTEDAKVGRLLPTELLAYELPSALPKEWFELACALTWSELSESQRKAAAGFLTARPAKTLTGMAMRAGFLGSAAEFEKAIRAWRERATPDELRGSCPAFLPQYLEIIGAGGEQWRSPLPSAPVILLRLADLCRPNN